MSTTNRAVLALSVVVALCPVAHAGETVIGLFTEDPRSQLNTLPLYSIDYLNVYLFVEEPVDAVAYHLDLTPVGTIAVLNTTYGPDGTGTATVDEDGAVVELGGSSVPDAEGKVLVARLEVYSLNFSDEYEYIRLGSHAGFPGERPSFQRGDGTWSQVDRSLPSLIRGGIRVLQPSPGDVVEAGGLSAYVYVNTLPVLLSRVHEVSLDGGQTWSPIEPVNCDHEGVSFCEWLVPSTPTSQARVRISLGGPGLPDPDRPELEFTIMGTVSSSEESWSAVKARF